MSDSLTRECWGPTGTAPPSCPTAVNIDNICFQMFAGVLIGTVRCRHVSGNGPTHSEP